MFLTDVKFDSVVSSCDSLDVGIHILQLQKMLDVVDEINGE